MKIYFDEDGAYIILCPCCGSHLNKPALWCYVCQWWCDESNETAGQEQS